MNDTDNKVNHKYWDQAVQMYQATELSLQGQLHEIGKEVSEQLEYVPSSFKAKEIVRYKYGCHHCEIGVSIAPKPGRAR